MRKLSSGGREYQDSVKTETGNGELRVSELPFIDQIKPNHLIKGLYMDRSVNREICLSYLQKYAKKDLNGIESMFTDDIILRDWKIRVLGKENALSETRKNFESVDVIAIDVLTTYENRNTVAAELKITIDNSEELYVVDVITLNSEGKIASIRAYLGRGDD